MGKRRGQEGGKKRNGTEANQKHILGMCHDYTGGRRGLKCNAATVRWGVTGRLHGLPPDTFIVFPVDVMGRYL